MNLQSVHVENFRSIERETLKDCGSFNVLIGKNNSGKSNVLSAIDTFFKCIKDAQIVSLNPPIGKEIDFYQRKFDSPIILTLTFNLSTDQRSALFNDIVTDSPQMRNAVDGLDKSLNLIATLVVQKSVDEFSVLSSLVLGSNKKSAESDIIIFSANESAAKELRDKAIDARQELQNSQELQQMLEAIDEDEYRVVKADNAELRTILSSRRRFLYSRNLVSSDVAQTIESAISDSTSYSDFKLTVNTLITKADENSKLISTAPLTNKIGTFSGEQSTIPNYVQKLLLKLSEMRVFYVKERRKDIGKQEAQQILSLKVQRGGDEKLRNIQSNVADLLGVQIDAFQSSSFSPRMESTAELDVDNFLVEVNGSGVREALRLILDVEFERPQILLVEEPEVHLHPALETSMMRYLRRISSGVQIFITTHSTNFLDTADMKNVYLISKSTSTQIQSLNLEEAESRIPSELGIRLSSLFMYDKLVFIEGPSDEAILREWASTIKVNFSQANVGFVSMGGVRNFTHYAAEETLSFLTKRQVGIWFLIDKDERDDSEVNKLQELVKGKATVKVLEKREVENYLICPRAIIEFIKLKKQSLGDEDNLTVTELDVQRVIDESAEKLKQIAINKRVAKLLCKPIFPSYKRVFEEPEDADITSRITDEISKMAEQLEESKTKLQDVYKQQSEDVNTVWEAQKLAIVPGDLLLDMVCQQYGVRFKKERDSARLAAYMNENEIDSKIKRMIEEICT